MPQDYKLPYSGTVFHLLLEKATTALQRHQDISHLASKDLLEREFIKRTVLPSLERVGEYLYAIDYDYLDYDFAKQFFLSKSPSFRPAGCSSVRNGNYYGRNLDWFYDNGVDFLVRTPSRNGKLAVMGIAGGLPELSKEVVAFGKYADAYRILPFYLQDGINEAGVFCNINVIPLDKGLTTLAVPSEAEKARICSLMLPRYILDTFSTADEAVEYLQKHVAIYVPRSLQEMGYEAHYMIGDATKTYVVELVDNQVVAHIHSRMTNFFIDGVTFNADGTVYTPADVDDGHKASDNGITEHGSGLERYNLIVENYAGANTKAGMRNLMNQLLYSRAYQGHPDAPENLWHTEFVGLRGLTVDSPAEDFAEIEEVTGELYASRDRNLPVDVERTWHTTHSSVYDLDTKKLYLVSQEDTEHEYVFGFKKYYSASEIDDLLAALNSN